MKTRCLLGVGATALALVVGGCTTKPSSPVATNRPPESLGTRCTNAPPDATCAAEVAQGLGFRFAWLPVPAGWRTGTPDHPGFIGRIGVPDAIAEEELHRGGITLVLASGGASDPPVVRSHRAFHWQGVVVHEASGVPRPRPSAAAWTIWYSWSSDGHPYRLIMVGYPGRGVGTLASGRRTARKMLVLVRFAAPGSTPGGA